MTASFKRQVFGIAGAAALAAAMLAAFGARNEGVAQSATAAPAVPPRVTYSAGMVGEVRSTSATDSIKKVYPMPGHPVFLTRTSAGMTVYERRGNAVLMLIDIKFDSSFDEVVFLDDQRTFVIKTNKSVTVFTVDRNVQETVVTKQK